MANPIMIGFGAPPGHLPVTAGCVYSNPCCPVYIISETGSGGGSPYLAYHKFFDLCVSVDKNVGLVWEFYGSCANRITIWAEPSGTRLYDTGCVLNGGTATVTIPAGSTFIEIQVDGSCNNCGTSDLWVFSFYC